MAWQELFSTDYGLMSFGVIVGVLVIGVYMAKVYSAKINEEAGKLGKE